MVWTTEQIGDQSQRTILITGASDGIGLECARALALRNAHLILVCRNATKMGTVAAQLRQMGASYVREVVCDLEDLESVCTCAAALQDTDAEIDVLVLNAGIATPGAASAQGYDRIIAVNHLGHFLLTALLVNKIRNGGRIVVVSSGSHKQAKYVDWNAVRNNQFTRGNVAYAQSKLCNLLFVEQLNRKLQAAGKNIVAVGAHPGFAKSHIFHEAPPSIMKSVMMFLMSQIAQSTEQGAWPLLMAVTCDNPQPTHYFAPSKGIIMSELHGPPIRNGEKSNPVLDQQLAELCWSESNKLTGCNFAL